VRAARRSGFTLLGFGAGLVAGAFVWSGVRHNYRRDLFSRRPFARFIALTYLASRPRLETVRLLRDYTRWEQNTMLRRHGMRLLRRVEGRVGAQG
jgi:hypothetical protein